MKRRKLLQGLGGFAGLQIFAPGLGACTLNTDRFTSSSKNEKPILVVLEMSGGNDGLNTVVPHADDEYYRLRPQVGIRKDQLLHMDDHFGFNPGMRGIQRLWQRGDLAVIHGCGYDQPSYSHFNSMAYWHTAAPNRGDEFGWMGRVADQLAPQRQEEMLINVAASQSLAVKSKLHTPLVFDDPNRFQRNGWMSGGASDVALSGGRLPANQAFLLAVSESAKSSSSRIRQAWNDFTPGADYGVVPMDLPKVAACISAGLPTQLYHVSVRNNAFDTHVAQPALHRRLLSYASDAVHGFLSDMQRLGQADRVVVMLHSEFGRRPMENANLGTDHGSSNIMMLAGSPVNSGHFGQVPSLKGLQDGDNIQYTTDFRRVYASIIEDWLKVEAQRVLKKEFTKFPLFV
jgi:uncharacterized protein (DUF1501 family)